MTLLTKEQVQDRGQRSDSYAPIARALHVLPEDAMSKLRVKHDIVHFVAIEKVAFSKYPSLCKLEAHHGVNVGIQ